MAGIAERVDHLRSDFSAAWTETRADSSDEVARIGSEVLRHGAHRDGRCLLHGPPPTGMRRSNDAQAPIADEHGGAVGHAYADGHIRIVAQNHIRIRPRPLLRRAGLGDGHLDAVNLPDEPQLLLLHSDALGDRVPRRVIFDEA
jgi:hypothetical protein